MSAGFTCSLSRSSTDAVCFSPPHGCSPHCCTVALTLSATAGSSARPQASTLSSWKSAPPALGGFGGCSELQRRKSISSALCVWLRPSLLCSGLQGRGPFKEGCGRMPGLPQPQGEGHVCRALRSPISASSGLGWGGAGWVGGCP